MENSIEEDIKILEEFKTNGYSILLMKYGDRIKTNFKLAKAIEHILTDYKRVLKENEYLQYKLREKISVEAHKQVEQNYIAKNIIKDKIEELKKKVEELTDEKGYWGGSDLLEQIKVLQVLLEKEK